MAYKQSEKRRLSAIGRTCGMSVVAFSVSGVLIGFLLGFLFLRIKSLARLYYGDPNFVTLLEGILSLVTLFLPFLAAYSSLKKRRLLKELPFARPRDSKDFILLIPIAFMICILGNMFTGAFSQAVNSLFGIEFIQPDDNSDYTTVTGALISLFSSALIPAFSEEFAIRGVVLQSLRKYGDGYAILMSSFVFALMHGNMIQIPFAFIAGIGLGYIAIKTHSLWTGILVHFLNNAFAVLLMCLSERLSSGAYFLFVEVSYAVIFVIGIICCVLFYLKNGNALSHLSRGRVSCLGTNEKITGFLGNMPMLCAMIILLVRTATYIKTING